MKLQYQINTQIQPSGDILLETMLGPENPIDGMYQRVSTQLYQLQDEAVRAALVKLGWTPPAAPPSPPPTEATADACLRMVRRLDRGALALALVELGYLSRPPTWPSFYPPQ